MRSSSGSSIREVKDRGRAVTDPDLRLSAVGMIEVDPAPMLSGPPAVLITELRWTSRNRHASLLSEGRAIRSYNLGPYVYISCR
jgi:hypothetical protein